MSAPYNPNIDLQVGRGHGLHLQINGRPVPDSYGAIVMAELAQLCEFPAVRVDVQLPRSAAPGAGRHGRMIADRARPQRNLGLTDPHQPARRKSLRRLDGVVHAPDPGREHPRDEAGNLLGGSAQRRR